MLISQMSRRCLLVADQGRRVRMHYRTRSNWHVQSTAVCFYCDVSRQMRRSGYYRMRHMGRLPNAELYTCKLRQWYLRIRAIYRWRTMHSQRQQRWRVLWMYMCALVCTRWTRVRRIRQRRQYFARSEYTKCNCADIAISTHVRIVQLSTRKGYQQ